ncbi:unnamed protein product [Effrenium voratum]|nr:unnamed protein product [Effrenium voratum]
MPKRDGAELQRWLLLLGAAATFFIFAPRGLLVGVAVLALLGIRCPRRLLSPGDSADVDEDLEVSRESPDCDWGPALVLVFEARDPLTGALQLRIDKEDSEVSWTLVETQLVPGERRRAPLRELLGRLNEAGLAYRLGGSLNGEFIFCMVRLPETTAKANLTFSPLDLELDPWRAQKYALELGMPLAKRCQGLNLRELTTCESFDSRMGELAQVPEALEDVWEGLHMRFFPGIPSRVFRHVPLVSTEGSDPSVAAMPTILPPSERLRMLLTLIGDDLPGAMGHMGPGFKLDQWKKPKCCNCLRRTFRNFGARRAANTLSLLDNLGEFPKAFSLYFLMQDPRDQAYQNLRLKFGRPASALFQSGLLSGVVDKNLPTLLQLYFGQQIGFYFAFLQHLFSYGFALTVLLAPLLAVYSVDWAQHLVRAMNTEAEDKATVMYLVDEMVSEITDAEASRSRWPLWSLLVGLTTTVWGQCVIESWHRQERRLARQWGCRPLRPTFSRPSFRGRLAVSRVDGRLVQVHRNRRLFQARVIAVNLCFLCIWALVFTVLGAIFLRNDQVQVATEDYASLGAVFSVSSVLLYHLFRIVAHCLTEAENHREEDSWETSILVKKWALTVIVQCWATMHLLFIRPFLWPCAYGDAAVRQRLDIEHCAFWDQECCDQVIRSNHQVLSFAEIRGEAVVRHTRQFIAGWLVSKIFLHNLLKWIVPRLFGFLCTRGLYPLLAVDFAEDLLTDLAMSDNEHGRRRVGRSRLRRCLCPRRPRYHRSYTDLAADVGPSSLPAELTYACECQLDKQEPWDVLDTATDLSVHFLVVSLTTVIYPFAPLLFLAHLLVEFQMDLFALLDRRQPKPRACNGLPEAWLSIFQSYVYVGALFNLAIVTWRTSLVDDLLGEGAGMHVAFFSTAMLLLVLVVAVVHLVIPRVPSEVVEHKQREREVEAFFMGCGQGVKRSDCATPVSWLHLQPRPLQGPVRARVDMLRRLSDSARVRLAARVALADRGGASVARVEGLSALMHALQRDAAAAGADCTALLELREEVSSRIRELAEQGDAKVRYAADRALRR